jgi:hypothetical protein
MQESAQAASRGLAALRASIRKLNEAGVIKTGGFVFRH